MINRIIPETRVLPCAGRLRCSVKGWRDESKNSLYFPLRRSVRTGGLDLSPCAGFLCSTLLEMIRS